MKLKLPEFTSLTRRFMAGVVPIALSGVLLTGGAAFYGTRHYILAGVEKEAASFAAGAAASVAGYFLQHREDLETLSESPLFADYHNNADYGLLEEAEQYREELGRYFRKFAARTGRYSRIAYVDSGLREICAVEDLKILPPGRRAVDPAAFRRAAGQKGDLVEFPMREVPGRGPVFTYARAVLDGTGALRGVLMAEAVLSPLRGVLDGLRIGDTGRTSLVDDSGASLLSAEPAAAEPDASADISAFAPVPGTRFRVRVVARSTDFHAPLKAITLLAATVVLLFGALVALFIYLNIRALTRPIKTLAAATRRLAEGNLTERVEESGRDEIGALSKAFNAMTQQLMERTGELKSRINELEALQEMSSRLIEKLEEEHICRFCLATAAKALGFERGAVYLVDREKSVIEGRYVHLTEEVGFDEGKMRLRAVPLDGGDILASVVRGKKPVNVTDPAKDPRVNPLFVEETATRAFCLVPMASGDEVIGVLAADNYFSGREIADEQVANLALFANFTALALSKARLVADVKASEGRYRAVLDSTPDAIIGLDPAFRITVWNRGAQALFDYLPDEILGRVASRLFEPLAFEEALREVRVKGSFIKSRVEGRDSTGRKLDLDVIWSGSGGKSEGEWTLVIRDTSEQRKLQLQLIQAEKLTAAGQMIAGVLHELNNPLTAVMGYAELLKGRADQNTPEAGDLTGLYESAVRCGYIVKNLLAFVRQSSGNRRVTDISGIVSSAIALTSYRLKAVEDISLEFDPAEQVPPVLADPRQIEQIMVNLIRNACDALAPRSGEKQIRVDVSCNEDFVSVSVSDNGPGVSPEVRSRLFEPFFTTKEEGKGTGLGLAICRRIAAGHGGDIYCRNASGGGAVFTLELPLAPVKGHGAVTEAADPSRPPPGARILVVDDEPAVLGYIERALEVAGQKVDTACGGLKAVEKLRSDAYDLVICDIEMGRVKGFSVREAMLEINSGAGLIFMTGDTMDEPLMERLKSMNVPFLPKPFNLAQLYAAMHKASPERGGTYAR